MTFKRDYALMVACKLLDEQYKQLPRHGWPDVYTATGAAVSLVSIAGFCIVPWHHSPAVPIKPFLAREEKAFTFTPAKQKRAEPAGLDNWKSAGDLVEQTPRTKHQLRPVQVAKERLACVDNQRRERTRCREGKTLDSENISSGLVEEKEKPGQGPSRVLQTVNEGEHKRSVLPTKQEIGGVRLPPDVS
ncbi:hypothetical protein PTTG_29025 [Puccinia triticina 1-1 BBBD Race 1]|uniref:Uncharacterized protein n=1 Tax=Puccinia triticina (isolate 1-1 / race 1 (BBBD)) TaxID=630390 RepID=A0A180G6X0_PUCT1|nr:hypothetical protein PTTG_29025 [Puccinia triticina 1-1 BBBD Race 1]